MRSKQKTGARERKKEHVIDIKVCVVIYTWQWLNVVGIILISKPE